MACITVLGQGLKSSVVPSLQSLGRNVYFVDIHDRMGSWHLADQVLIVLLLLFYWQGGLLFFFLPLTFFPLTWRLVRPQVHPNEEGYKVIADAFYDGVKMVLSNLVNSPAPSVGGASGGDGPVLANPVSLEGETIGIMPIGDSITEGFPTPGGYR